jgi:hypothetical protein
MKILSLFLFLALFRPVFAQDAAGASGQAPPDVDQALRARVKQFYQAYLAGKFSEAYPLVEPESQDAFIRSDKLDFKECQTDKIEYSDNFSHAVVTDTCKGVWIWHGHTSPMAVPVDSHWKLSNNQWLWYYVKPSRVPNPFSPSGFTELPPGDTGTNSSATIPRDMHAVALNILSKVNLDKNSVTVRADTTSKDELHVRNDMPGEVTLAIGHSPVGGLKVTASKNLLKAGETAVLTFEYAPDDKTIACGDCATRIRSAWVQLTIEPTGQTFQIAVNFTNQKTQEFPLPK